MPELTLTWGDHALLPKERMYGANHGEDAVWIMSQSWDATYDAPLFVDNLQYVSDRVLSHGVTRQRLLSGEIRYHNPPLVYVVLHDARLVHQWGVVDRNDKCYLQLVPPSLRGTMLGDGFADRLGAPPRTFSYEDEEYISGDTVILPLEAIPLSHLLFQGFNSLSPFDPASADVMVRMQPNNCIRELLDLAGWGEDQVRYRSWSRGLPSGELGTIQRFERLIVPVPCRVHPMQREIYRRMGRGVEVAPGERAIYISRADHRQRRTCLNEDKIIDLMSSRGIETVRCAELTEREKIGLFKSAWLVVGAVGAGLYNTIFSEYPTMMLALNGATYTDHLLRQTATIGGHPYGIFLGPEFASYDKGVHNGMHNDFLLNVEQLARRLDQIMEARSKPQVQPA